jgi:large subunit ribosomal protein L30
MAKKTLRVKYVKSCIGYPLRQKRTLWALGLKHLGEEIRVTDNKAVRGMLRRVSHLVEVVEP